jgi:hypothetical protein
MRSLPRAYRSGKRAGGLPRRKVEGPLDAESTRCAAESARAARDDLRLPDDYPTVWKIRDENSSGGTRMDLIAVCRRPRDGPGTVPGFFVDGDVRCVRETTKMSGVTRADQMMQAAVHAFRRLEVAREWQF